MKIILLYFLSIILQSIKTVDFTEAMNNLKLLEEHIKDYKTQNNINNSLTHLIVCYIREGLILEHHGTLQEVQSHQNYQHL